MRFLKWIVRTLILFGSIYLLRLAIVPGYRLHEWLTVELGRVIDWESTWQQVGTFLAIGWLGIVFSTYFFGPKETDKKTKGILSRTGGAALGAVGIAITRILCWWLGLKFPEANN